MAQFININNLPAAAQNHDNYEQPMLVRQAEQIGHEAVAHAIEIVVPGNPAKNATARGASGQSAHPVRARQAYGDLIKEPRRLPGGVSEDEVAQYSPFLDTFEKPAVSWLNNPANPDLAPGVSRAARQRVAYEQQRHEYAHSPDSNAATLPAIFAYDPRHPSNLPTKPLSLSKVSHR